jgi:hypothetical protein
MKTATTCRLMIAAAVSATLGAVAPVLAASNEIVEPARRMERMLPIRDVRLEHGVVTGEVVNATSPPMRDVRLDIEYQWRWTHEFRPGTDRFSRLEHLTVPGEIPPGGRREFAFRPDQPLETGHGGRYTAIVHVARAVEIGG